MQHLADKRLSGWSGVCVFLITEMVSERKDLQSIKQNTQHFAGCFAILSEVTQDYTIGAPSAGGTLTFVCCCDIFSALLTLYWL